MLVGLIACSRDAKSNKAGVAASATSTTPADTATPAALSGTRWSLVEIQSMSDGQGATRPDDPAKYTLAFDTESSDADGLLWMRLDCNRAHGTYRATRSSSLNEGSLSIAPLAVTRASCPSSSLSDRIARDMASARSYRFVNGRLTISLMSDGDSYVWRRDAVAR